MAIGLPNLRNLVFDREGMPSLGSLGIDLSNLPTIDPGTIKKMPATTTTGAPGSAWWQDAGYPDAATAIQSGNFRYDMNTGWQLKPGAETPAMKLAAATTPEDTTTMVSDESTMSPTSYSSETPSAEEMFNALANADNEADLNYDLTDVIAQLQNEAAAADITTAAVDKAVETASGGQGIATGYSGDGYADTAEEEQSDNDVVKELIDSISVNNTSESAIDAAIAAAVAAAQGEGMTEIAAKEEVEKELASDPATKAVDAAVGNGQATTDDTILDQDTTTTTMPDWWSEYGYSSAIEAIQSGNFIYDMNTGWQPISTTGTGTDTTGTDQTAADQAAAAAAAEQAAAEQAAAEQAAAAAAAEQAAAAEAERQKQLADMTLNYTIGQPAVGYNPYQSGQYQNNPYGSAGVPDMGGITSIPVPAAYTPNPYLIGGTT